MVTAPVAAAVPSTGALIAEVYGGGGNSGAELTNDFVELATVGSAAASLDGFTVQYLPASPSASSRWQATALTGAIEPDARYLVAQGRGAGGTVELPTPDAAGSIAMSASAGTVALVASTEPLTCRTAADCAADARIVDLVGYGGAVVRENSPAPGTNNTTSVARPELTDTDSNAADFTAGAPSPTNTAGETPDDGGDPDPEPPTAARIHDIQGTTRISPLAGERVGVTGVVTTTRNFGSRGFWMQDPESDDDPRTSEGIFVYSGSVAPDVAPGDEVTVTATVKEYYPDNPSSSKYQSLTELTDAQWTVVSGGNPVPEPTVITQETLPDELVAQPGGNIEPLPLEPDRYSLDFWEAHESELISVSDARVVGPSSQYNELYVTTKPEQNPSVRGGTVYQGYDRPNTGILKIESLIPFAERPFPQANTGDVLTGLTAGPVEYDSFGGYTLFASMLGEVKDNGLAREVTRAQRGGELAIATYNVENLSARNEQAKFDELARGVVDNLASPDIVTLEEIQDNNGPDGRGDGVVAADETMARFVDAIAAAGGPRYEWRQIDPQDLTDGGQPGGNIRVGFLFNPDRVSFVDRPGGDAVTPVEVSRERGRAKLSVSPGRIDPANAAWEDSRKSLAGEFVFRGRTVFVVANHFASKGGDQPTHGRFQPPNRGSEEQRVAQAQAVRGFVDDVLAADPRANVVVAGDINDYSFSPTVRTLTEGGALTALIDTLPEGDRYSYVFEGNSQVLDHVLISVAPRGVDYDVVHINAEFAEQASDHDPQLVRFLPGTGNPALDAVNELIDWLERIFGRR
ncbi:endonuclease/exonuclease/phosphatase family protein [Amycolatopsis marina]|nr:endonuclease/exonuclease/phosphatase family protein [Amycolatopsis marina]